MALSAVGGWGRAAPISGQTVQDFLTNALAQGTLLQRLPTLAEVAETAAFLASDRSAPMTGAIANLTAGALVD